LTTQKWFFGWIFSFKHWFKNCPQSSPPPTNWSAEHSIQQDHSVFPCEITKERESSNLVYGFEFSWSTREAIISSSSSARCLHCFAEILFTWSIEQEEEEAVEESGHRYNT
jgi:hypothetical protein